MNKKISQKIVSYKVSTEEQTQAATAKEAESNIIQMHEKVSRPEELAGSTYKIKTPMSDHALYLTINDIVLNQGTDHELRRPFEVFINSKNMDHFQWIVALTRVLSAVFRKGGERVPWARPDDRTPELIAPRNLKKGPFKVQRNAKLRQFWNTRTRHIGRVSQEFREISDGHIIKM